NMATLFTEPFGEALGDIDRTMAAASTSDGYRQIALALALVARQQRLEPVAELIEETREIGIGGDVFADGAILARERLQARNVMRIAQEAHIEHEVGIPRQAMAERERGDENSEAGLGREMEIPVQHAFQIAWREQRRVDDQIGAVAQRTHALALQAYTIADRSLCRERMRAARLGVAPLETIIVAIEENDAEIQATVLDQAVERRDQRGHCEVARAHIDTERERRLIGSRPDEIGQKRQR